LRVLPKAVETILGTLADDALTGTDASETLQGKEGNDAISAGGGDDIIDGDEGNDILNGGAGDDSVSGGAGFDICQYAGSRSQIIVTRQSDTVVKVNASASGEGSDTLLDIERIQVSDGTIALDLTGAAGQTYRLYQAAFDRTPDDVGLSHNVHLMDGGLGIFDMAAAFIASEEFQQTYGSGISNTAFITLLYQNVLNRGPDDAGLAGWLDAMSGGQSHAQVLFGFSESTENKANVAAAIDDGIWLV
jgi:Ca2+-binding RTX toxin-like protein